MAFPGIASHKKIGMIQPNRTTPTTHNKNYFKNNSRLVFVALLIFDKPHPVKTTPVIIA
jgi:hypothetical protein